MFHKDDSSVLSKGKKSVDVPLRKSDRKKALSVAAGVFEGNAAAAVLNAAFLEGTLVSRKIIHPQLGRVQLYFRSPQGEGETTTWPYTHTTQCVWISVDHGPNCILHAPTVALLAVLPNFPTVIVPSQVSKFMCRGAHLMRAGILSLPSANSGIVAVRVNGNPQPFAVGRITEGTSLQTIRANGKGVGVEVWTCYGDDIWRQALAHTTDEGIVNPNGGACYDNGKYGNVGFIEGKIVRPIVAVDDKSSDEGDDEAGKSGDATAVSPDATTEPSTPPSPTVDACEQNEEAASMEIKNGDHDNKDDGQGEGNGNDVNPHDVILHQAVCNALVNIKDCDLPMTTANLYAQHVKPRSDPPIEIKLTSWKKLGNYLQEQQDNGLLTVKAHGTDPVGYLTGINRKREDLRGIRKDNKEASQTKKLTVVNLYIVPHHFVSLLRLDPDVVNTMNAKSDERRGTGMLTVPEARAILDQYVAGNELSVSSKEVQLDGPLTDALFKKQDAPEKLSRKDLNNKWIDKMEPAYALVEMPGNHIRKLGRGSPPKVSVEVSLRQGRKYITRVRGLEDYDIDPVAFSKDVTKRFACAGTVETDPEGRAALKKGRVELEFQGHLVEELRALLLGDETLTSHGGAKDSHYFVPKSAIDVLLKKNVPGKKPRKR